MKTERSVKLIRKKQQPPPEVASAADNSKFWTTEVKSWVAKFQQRRTSESLQQFSSLFKSSPGLKG